MHFGSGTVAELAILALTPAGARLGQRIRRALGRGEIIKTGESPRRLVQGCFQHGVAVIGIMPLGVMVQALGPLLPGKSARSPVVVVDEAGTYAVSVPGGPAAGASTLVHELAHALGLQPVPATTTEVLQLPVPDLIGKPWGWKIQQRRNLARVTAAVVRGQPVAVFQEAGSRTWWKPFGTWPHQFERLDRWPTRAHWQGLLVISDRVLPPLPAGLEPCTLVYRPPLLTLGVACRHGLRARELTACARDLFQRHGLAPASLAALASISLNQDEDGLRLFAERLEIPFLTYTADRLKLVGPLPTPSERVRQRIGVAGVCEPAAMLAAGVRELVVPKTCFRRLTLAVARRPVTE
jgi:cobalt-precorrin 5A hydrolase